MPLLAALEWGKILEVLWVAPVAGIGITTLFSIAIVGSTRAAEASRASRPPRAAAYGLLAFAAFSAFAASCVFGIYVILDK